MKKIRRTVCLGVLALAIAMYVNSGVSFTTIYAKGIGYQSTEQTENMEVINITEEIGQRYGICPELLQAIVFYESSNTKSVVSKSGDIGYMQVNPKWHKDRMNTLGVTNLKNGYENILTGTDYLAELAAKYEDIGLVLMKYNGDSRADKLHEVGKTSDYAGKILKLSQELERLHGK